MLAHAQNTTGLQSTLVVLFFFSSNLNNSHAGILNPRPTSTSVRQRVSKKVNPAPTILQNCPAELQTSNTNAFQLSTVPAATCAVGTHQY
jgi:hypothetical protein